MERIQAALQKAKQQSETHNFPERAVSFAAAIKDEVWTSLKPLKADPRQIAANRLITMTHSDPAHTHFDILRTRVLQQLRQNDWTSVAITSPTPGCGKTLVALNLAFSLANQKDCRTALIDLDMRRPQVAKLLGIREAPSMETFLKGQSEAEEVFLRHGENVAIAGNRAPVQFAAELLQSPAATAALKRMKQRLKPDVVIYDLPPMLANDDVMAFLPSVDCVILVAAAEASTFGELDACERELAERSNFLGIVLNKCRYVPEKYGY
ncbi:CpsD/CapB family tyrosine-protein kinase [Aquamicrobium sp. LC103]|uniref:CpsD/CapB family tyrosine-protein kinase n=1 Tax=Aquamicrobium sp. LC103 TaxID=1120658 RepID=UPI0006998162|nr:CpsD/CapB family tyrosine-protein kinase [Aquamicrobium sp. LC103]TKT80278.1 CpsD/CapB family tyrosine-protein kinase [Aquamicrobium sp. LC103]